MAAKRAIYLGLDASTQSLSATALEASTMRAVFTASVNYDADLPSFDTKGGFHQADDGRVTSPTAMWVSALDELLRRMESDGFPFGSVRALSGSGQQHGSVYWRRGAAAQLGALRAAEPLAPQLADAFSVPESPIWADSSTGAQCRALTDALGGPLAVAELTGSSAYERFTGNQIAKIAAEQADAYADTERISLVSSFVPSLLLGAYAPIDYSDGAGMNLMDLRKRTWAPEALAATAPDLLPRLGDIVSSHSVLGKVAPYFVERYGFSADCRVVAWSGDNPNSVAGLGLKEPGDVAVSLGTSDTLFGITAAPAPGIEGHLFPNPVDPESYMAMVCYKNGSLTRESVRDRVAGASWERFEEAMRATKPGNDGHLGFYILQPEITPRIPVGGVTLFAPNGDEVAAFDDPAREVRAVVEGQFLSMRVHAASVGITAPKRVLVTGGASRNASITRVIADVFGAPVVAASQPDSASLGAALRAAHGARCEDEGRFVPFSTVVGDAVESDYKLVAEPDAEAHATYTELLPAYSAAEAKVVSAAAAAEARRTASS